MMIIVRWLIVKVGRILGILYNLFSLGSLGIMGWNLLGKFWKSYPGKLKNIIRLWILVLINYKLWDNIKIYNNQWCNSRWCNNLGINRFSAKVKYHLILTTTKFELTDLFNFYYFLPNWEVKTRIKNTIF